MAQLSFCTKLFLAIKKNNLEKTLTLLHEKKGSVKESIFSSLQEKKEDISFLSNHPKLSKADGTGTLLLSTASHKWEIVKAVLDSRDDWDTEVLIEVICEAADDSKWDIVENVTEKLKEELGLSSECVDRLLHCLWEVVRGSKDNIAQLLCDDLKLDPRSKPSTQDTSPWEEAHARGLTQIIAAFNKVNPPERLTAEEQAIIDASKTHQKHKNDLFNIARADNDQVDPYGRSGGVKEMLDELSGQSTTLPATVRGPGGVTLVHIAASWEDGNRLSWTPDNLEALIKNHHGYINSVDCEGRTPLHHLCMNAPNSKVILKPWIPMVEKLLELGANPWLRDHRGKLPEDLAISHDLEELLIQKREKSKPPPTLQPKKRTALFKNLNDAAAHNDIEDMMILIEEGAPLEAQDGYSGMLHHAITMGHRDASLMGLAAGASTRGRSSDGLTILDAAHRTPNIPALFPAIIRDEYCLSLKVELKKIPKEKRYIELRGGLNNLMNGIQNYGHRAKWKHNENNDQWQLLVAAAGLGLTLTCQFLGWGEVRTSRLPHDTEHPLLAALSNSQNYIIWSLCRDMVMNPYLVPGLDIERFPSGLLDFMLQCEKDKIELMAVSKKHGHMEAKQSLEFMENSNFNSKILCQSFLYTCGKLGLLHILNKYIKHVNIDIVIDECTRSNILHIACFYGHHSLVEYLALSGMSTEAPAQGRFLPCHITAYRGHSKCYNYLRYFPGSDCKSENGMTLEYFKKGLEENIKSFKLTTLSTRDEDYILSDYDPRSTTKVLLSGKCKGMGINYSSLKTIALDSEVDMSDLEQKIIKETLLKEITHLSDIIGCTDKDFRGTLINVECSSEQFFLPNRFKYYLNVDSFKGLKIPSYRNGSTILTKKLKEIYFKDNLH
ncbi:unnamed protein product, partial [Meganyctiphanes norvegica]